MLSRPFGGLDYDGQSLYSSARGLPGINRFSWPSGHSPGGVCGCPTKWWAPSTPGSHCGGSPPISEKGTWFGLIGILEANSIDSHFQKAAIALFAGEKVIFWTVEQSTQIPDNRPAEACGICNPKRVVSGQGLTDPWGLIGTKLRRSTWSLHAAIHLPCAVDRAIPPGRLDDG